MAIYRNCVCVELNKLKSPLKCGRVLYRHPHAKTAGAALSEVCLFSLFSLALIAGTSPQKSISARLLRRRSELRL